MKRYTFIDYATQGYITLVGLLVLCLHGDAVPGWGWFVAAHAGCLLVNHLLIVLQARWPANRWLDFLRHFYPVLLYAGFYRETGSLNRMLYAGYLDPAFIRCEQAIFGCQPSLAFMDRLPFLPVSELFYASYFSYYLMIVGVGLALFLRRREQFHHYVAISSFVFYVCYLIYIFLPVIGPPVFYEAAGERRVPDAALPAVIPDFPLAVQAGPFFRIMAFIYANCEAPGAAFPSSHVAVAIVTVYFSFLYLRRIRWPHLAVATCLCLATVYCRYHYAIDVVAGALTAAGFIPLGNWLYSKFARARPARGTDG